MEGVSTDDSVPQLQQTVEKELHSADTMQQLRDSGLSPGENGLQHEGTNLPSAMGVQSAVSVEGGDGVQSVSRAADTDQPFPAASPSAQPPLFSLPKTSDASSFTAPFMTLTAPLHIDADSEPEPEPEPTPMMIASQPQPQPQPQRLTVDTSRCLQTFSTLQPLPVVSVRSLPPAQPAVSIVSVENGIVTVTSADSGSIGSQAATVQSVGKGLVTTAGMVTIQSFAAGFMEDEAVNGVPGARSGVADSQSHKSQIRPDVGSYCFAESELVALDSVDVEGLVPSEIVGETGEVCPESEAMDGVELSDGASSACSSSSRWHRVETLKLIELYKEYQGYFEDKHYKKKTVWAMLAARLGRGGKSKARYTSAQVCNRWKNLTKTYRDCVESLEQAGPWVGKCQYFDELDHVYSLTAPGASSALAPRPHASRGSNTKSSLNNNRLLQRLAKRAGDKKQPPSSSSSSSFSFSSSSAASHFVAIAPKRPLPSVSLTPSASSDVSSIVVLADKTASVPAGCSASGSATCFGSVVRAVQALHADQKRVDRWKLDRLEKMHKEKMHMFERFLDVLKECKQ